MSKKNRKARRMIENLAAIEHEIAESEQQIDKLMSEAESVVGGLLESPHQHVALGDILNAAQIQAVVDILNRPNISDYDQTKLLKEYLNQYRADLDKKGVLPDYLAYVLMHNANQLRAMAKASNAGTAPHSPLGPHSQN